MYQCTYGPLKPECFANWRHWVDRATAVTFIGLIYLLILSFIVVVSDVFIPDLRSIILTHSRIQEYSPELPLE